MNIFLYIPGAGCISLNGTSATNSPPMEPRSSLTRATYETTKPVASLHSAMRVDEAKLTSSSCQSNGNPFSVMIIEGFE